MRTGPKICGESRVGTASTRPLGRLLRPHWTPGGYRPPHRDLEIHAETGHKNRARQNLPGGLFIYRAFALSQLVEGNELGSKLSLFSAGNCNSPPTPYSKPLKSQSGSPRFDAGIGKSSAILRGVSFRKGLGGNRPSGRTRSRCALTAGLNEPLGDELVGQ